MHVIQVKLHAVSPEVLCKQLPRETFLLHNPWGLFLTAILPGYEKGQQHDATEFLHSLVNEVGKDR